MRNAFVAALVLALAGCGTAEPLLRHQASVDLSCAPEQLHTAPAALGGEDVSGCGHEARYVADRNGWELETLDGATTPKPSDQYAVVPRMPSVPLPR